MSAYGDLLRTRGVARIIAAQLVARFPSGMLSLALLFHVEHRTGSYAAAGVVLAALSLGQAVAGPATGRLMGRVGMRPVLITTTLVCALAVTAIALLPVAGLAVAALALVAGLAFPPVTSAVRTIYPKLVTAKQLNPLFSLDASLQEIIWIGGPVAITFVATGVSTVAGLLLAVALMLAGGAWFASSPEVGRVRIPRSKRRFGRVLLRPPVLVATGVGFLLIACCSAVEASVPGAFGANDPVSGVVLAIWSLASLIGGFALGRLVVRPWSLAARLAIVAAGGAITPFVHGFWALSAALVVCGFGIAPALGVLSATVSSSVRFSDTAEAYGWTNTGQLVGVALGAAAAGALIDRFGASASFAAAAALALAAAVVAAASIPVVPDLRRVSGPVPETAPIPVTPS